MSAGIEFRDGNPYWSWGISNYEHALDFLRKSTSGHRLQEYFQLTSIPNYQQLEQLGRTATSKIEFGLLVENSTAFLVQGLEGRIGQGFMVKDGVICLHTHFNGSPPSENDLAIAGDNSHSAYGIITKQGIYSYSGLFVLKEKPKDADTEKAKMGYFWRALNRETGGVRPENDDIFWEKYVEALRAMGAIVDFYPWGPQAEEFWNRLLQNYQSFLAYHNPNIAK